MPCFPAVEEGRKIYANIQKFVCFLLGTNIGEIIYLTIAIAASLPLPLEALQARPLSACSKHIEFLLPTCCKMRNRASASVHNVVFVGFRV